jgi:cell division control protein 24
MGTGNMLVKVRCGEDHFVIGMAGDVDFATFYNKVSKKIKMCARGSVMSDNIHIKWVDLDDDEVSIRCNADLEAMFGEIRDSGINTVNIIAR